MTPDLQTKVLRYVQLTSALTKRACAEVAERRAAEKTAADQIPALVEKMLAAQVIGDHQKQAAEALLRKHGGALGLLANAVGKIKELSGQTKAAGDLGEGVGEGTVKGAGAHDPTDSLTNPWVGRRSSEKRASDVALLSVLEPPTAA